MLNIVQVTLLCLLVSCQNSDKRTSPISESSKTNYNLKGTSQTYDTSGFFSNCKSWSMGTFEGYMQGIDVSRDSLGSFCFYECYECKETFEIIFIPKTKQGANVSVWTDFEDGCKNEYIKFDCFAFVYPMKDPDKQKDVHAMNIDFPLIVRAYERTIGDKWKFLEKVSVKSFHELSLFKFKSIYHLY